MKNRINLKKKFSDILIKAACPYLVKMKWQGNKLELDDHIHTQPY